ncbi:tetratricopeptide repeat protein [Viridibacterium curvum]|uniref:Tetratricopeptide repeat protein n=1 Tax=Viridibacterium curvum TaxID=1101404 RepID=A0ABP9R3P7_9RHOO
MRGLKHGLLLALICALSLPAGAAKVVASKTKEAAAKPAPVERSAYEQAVQAVREGRIAEAVPALHRQLTATPGHINARMLLATLLVDGGKLDEAETVLEPATDLASLKVLARLQAMRGNPAMALASLKRGELEGAMQGEYLAFAALLAQEAGLHDEALAYFERALQLPDAKPQLWLAVAVSQQALGAPDRASGSIRRALKSPQLSPDSRREGERMLRDLTARAEIRAREAAP